MDLLIMSIVYALLQSETYSQMSFRPSIYKTIESVSLQVWCFQWALHYKVIPSDETDIEPNQVQREDEGGPL